MKEIVLYLCYY